MSTKYKVGDVVKVVNLDKSINSTPSRYVGQQASVIKAWLSSNNKTFYNVRFNDNQEYVLKSSELEIINSGVSLTKTNTMGNFTEKFVQLFLTEPIKSLRKTGLINGSNLATSEGITLYVSYLMAKDDAFNKEVVQAMLKKGKKDEDED